MRRATGQCSLRHFSPAQVTRPTVAGGGALTAPDGGQRSFRHFSPAREKGSVQSRLPDSSRQSARASSARETDNTETGDRQGWQRRGGVNARSCGRVAQAAGRGGRLSDRRFSRPVGEEPEARWEWGSRSVLSGTAAVGGQSCGWRAQAAGREGKLSLRDFWRPRLRRARLELGGGRAEAGAARSGRTGEGADALPGVG